MPELYVYAELLLHIRQLTLYASLSEDKHKGTQIFISSDKKVITAVYGDERASIYLPTQIKGTANVTFPLGKRTEFSTKLQIDDQNELQHAIETSSEIQVPCTATSLQPGVQLRCKACSAIVVEEGVIVQWKDLPSENWAELMDLWFCHKPHEHDHDHDDTKAAAASKGFADQSKILNERGTGMVDSLSFLIHGDDSKAIQSDDQDVSEIPPSLQVAAADQRPDLFLQHLHRRPAPPTHRTHHLTARCYPPSPPRESDSKSHSSPPPGLLLWIFNPDIYYSASRRRDPEPTVHRALKVFYQEVSDPAKLLDSHQSTLEELALPKPEYETFYKELVGSKDYMPVSARTFQDWQVGLLDRWEETASGLGAMDQNALNRAVEGDMELFKAAKVDLPGSEGLYD
ncbi:uncharacterized protein AB675_2584 [Cyphellophora attinorum]|uniref:Uncharacterized protein n=1 Tax=Cyphellophora attinorum TaxID=1664694 RepID=A0A0N1HG83_9EURO|nr:uncharacterized protein AB675_2584 [Phialophora attinorum]KPI45120.1 hypothetical protein AB675_2584 [Phialophora attinorum]